MTTFHDHIMYPCIINRHPSKTTCELKEGNLEYDIWMENRFGNFCWVIYIFDMRRSYLEGYMIYKIETLLWRSEKCQIIWIN